MLLGDAGCYRTSKSLTSNSRLEFSFGQHRLVFAQFVEALLKEYVNTPVTPLLVQAIKGGEKNHTSYRLKTLALPVFNYYRELFYKLDESTGKYIKVIPSNINELLSPIVLAHLVMGFFFCLSFFFTKKKKKKKDKNRKLSRFKSYYSHLHQWIYLRRYNFTS